MKASDEELVTIENAIRIDTGVTTAWLHLRAELLALRKVADAALCLERVMADVDCPCEDKSCESLCKALREAGR